jgi:hypothetical protein
LSLCFWHNDLHLQLCFQKWQDFHFFYNPNIFYGCVGWGYIVAWTNVIAVYQICHGWIHLLHHSTLSLLRHSWNGFNMPLFSFMYMCTQYLHYIHPPSLWKFHVALPCIHVFIVAQIGSSLLFLFFLHYSLFYCGLHTFKNSFLSWILYVYILHLFLIC